jgi:hypothetical protein
MDLAVHRISNSNSAEALKRKSSRSWLESLEIDVKTLPSEPNSCVGFLHDINPMQRSVLLARHDVHCKRVKYDHFMIGYKQAEAAQEDIPNSTNGDQHSEIIKLNEPFSLRMSMYEKMIIHFQHFYNDQDVLPSFFAFINSSLLT